MIIFYRQKRFRVRKNYYLFGCSACSLCLFSRVHTVIYLPERKGLPRHTCGIRLREQAGNMPVPRDVQAWGDLDKRHEDEGAPADAALSLWFAMMVNFLIIKRFDCKKLPR